MERDLIRWDLSKDDIITALKDPELLTEKECYVLACLYVEGLNPTETATRYKIKGRDKRPVTEKWIKDMRNAALRKIYNWRREKDGEA